MNRIRNLAMELYLYNKRIFIEAEKHFFIEGAPFQSQEYWDSRKFYWNARKI